MPTMTPLERDCAMMLMTALRNDYCDWIRTAMVMRRHYGFSPARISAAHQQLTAQGFFYGGTVNTGGTLTDMGKARANELRNNPPLTERDEQVLLYLDSCPYAREAARLINMPGYTKRQVVNSFAALRHYGMINKTSNHGETIYSFTKYGRSIVQAIQS